VPVTSFIYSSGLNVLVTSIAGSREVSALGDVDVDETPLTM
jgi:hypothetical protein